ncbi:GNAT family N-acetyltransferase [Polynucleobacter sp. UK-Kesae-W10]|uniref:GNAT family N-acetyltransferase n=1 Tax=Polynucleobacter sp. UK-Kesae-W10 TaxID=1819738 RepID=UPI001C0C91A7|nr:GNAT family N-acetyltransferase [Polynucleobacter sp. UK-Kesae-W10]MBU3577512.1 GNAT family N-acetyltransferase [Polynucleobacter sp. UK-Kesae-W10]
MKYSVRRVDPKDPEIWAILERMQLQCLPGDIPQKPKEGYWWICYAETGIPIGFAGMVHSIRWEQTGYLSRSGILPAHQGKGLQKRLIKARVVKAKQLGWKWLLSDTSENPASANSLISCGFKMYEPRHVYGLKTSLYWRKKI